jgi:drug/metabolite transporter (DMT)-like permease
MLAAGMLLAVAGAATGEFGQLHPTHVSTGTLGALAYLVVAGSLVGYTAYGWLIRNVSTTLLSTHAYVNPVVAVALGAALLGEPLTGTTLVAGGLVVLSVVLIVARPKRREPAPVIEIQPVRAEPSQLAA